ncbi:MAG: PPC domain-containing protein, partial [Deltaproteobacteria bacterium]|nr:PPC domain-containing protein [Deltaproteobacteria bacterium]
AGQRVVVSGGPDITAETGILPSGTFCHDATLETDGATELELYTVDGNGSVSEAVVVEVSHDSSAPMPIDPTCSGSARRECTETEVCSSGGDDDCDGFEDACDSDCNGCQDDAFEPNDGPIAVPYLPGRGAYDLELCPCRPDWFAFFAQEGERIRVRADFDSAEMNLNLRLYPAAAPEGSNYVDSAFGSGDSEEIDYTAEASGIYYLNVYVFSTDEDAKRGSYTLSVL